MTYAIENDNERPDQADGPFRTGVYQTVAAAKEAGERTAKKEGLTNVVIRDRGDTVSIFAGDLVSEFIDGVWHDRGIFDVQNWWPKLDEDTRTWLLEHADEQIPTEILHRIVAVGGIVPGTQWEGEGDYDFRLPYEAAEWIKQQA
ncbi:hypothetical protein [Curtobacterium flaccumfaciens]|uniref:hypothetical protein n=1 Tax=Curtobacterium flaccumfaciens TaxID=2035 RepID=UPI0039911B92